MNERIKELAIEAGGGPSKWYTDPAVLEYFTELIVRECADISNQAEKQCQHPGTMMKKHFGIEE